MKELFKVGNTSFYEEDFLDDISEFDDIIPIIKDLEDELTVDEITCAQINDCCEKTKDNLFVEIGGFVDDEGEFYYKKDLENLNKPVDKELFLFVIRVYMCLECRKWIIDILE